MICAPCCTILIAPEVEHGSASFIVEHGVHDDLKMGQFRVKLCHGLASPKA
jgi:hypothetical protein